MNIIKNIFDINFDCPLSVCIGNFDGIHLAHRKILEETVKTAKNNKCISAAITFNPHPLKFFGCDLKLINTERKKYELIEKINIDYTIVLNFDENIATMPPEFFVEEILVKKFNTKFLTVGYNYKFGYKNQGDVNLLKLLSKKYNFTVNEIERIIIKDILVSSSNIRDLIVKGEIELANELLGYFYCLEGLVIKGQSLGKLLGFPTANIDLENELVPKLGVYVSRIKINNNYYPSVTNIGTKPTIGKDNKISTEAHIIDFEKNIYGAFVELELIAYLREEKKFKNFNNLVKQMKKDKTDALKVLKQKQII